MKDKVHEKLAAKARELEEKPGRLPDPNSRFCSFCGKEAQGNKGQSSISNDSAFVCDECIDQSQDMLRELGEGDI